MKTKLFELKVRQGGFIRFSAYRMGTEKAVMVSLDHVVIDGRFERIIGGHGIGWKIPLDVPRFTQKRFEDLVDTLPQLIGADELRNAVKRVCVKAQVELNSDNDLEHWIKEWTEVAA